MKEYKVDFSQNVQIHRSDILGLFRKRKAESPFSESAVQFERGFGVLDVGSTKLKHLYMINPRVISDTDALEIVELFGRIKNRNVMDIEDELKDSDREIFDRKILKAIGHDEIYDEIKESLLQYTRYD